MEFSGSAKQPLQALKRLKNAQASQSVAVGRGARPVGLPGPASSISRPRLPTRVAAALGPQGLRKHGGDSTEPTCELRKCFSSLAFCQ